MSDDWKVGDLAVADDPADNCPACGSGSRDPEAHPKGTALPVLCIESHPWLKQVGLWFSVTDGPWCSCAWRKVRPDANEGDLHDWELLLDSVTRRVDA